MKQRARRKGSRKGRELRAGEGAGGPCHGSQAPSTAMAAIATALGRDGFYYVRSCLGYSPALHLAFLAGGFSRFSLLVVRCLLHTQAACCDRTGEAVRQRSWCGAHPARMRFLPSRTDHDKGHAADRVIQPPDGGRKDAEDGGGDDRLDDLLPMGAGTRWGGGSGSGQHELQTLCRWQPTATEREEGERGGGRGGGPAAAAAAWRRRTMSMPFSIW